MDPVQTTVEEYPARAIAGMLDSIDGHFVSTGLAEVAVNAGLVVVPGTDAAQIKRPVSAANLATAFLNAAGGIVVHVHRGAAGDAYLYPVSEAVNVLRKGRIWAKTETALAKGAHPYVRFTAAGAEELGALRNDADTSDAVQVPWIVVLEAATVAGPVLVEINLPYPDVNAEITIGATAPTTGASLEFNSTSGRWEPAVDNT